MAVRARTKRARPVASPAVAALAGIPAGPALSAALAALELRSLSGFDLPLVLKARYRQGNHERAMLLLTVAETMVRKDPEYGRYSDAEDEVGNYEISAALHLTRPATNILAGLARDLMVRLPAVLDAALVGDLDQPRARIFSTWTAELSDPHAQAVVAALLPVAPRMTTAQLIKAIARVAIELDPQWARRRYENALQARDVRGVIDTDGTATLTGTNLPADRVAAACDRLDALAHAVKRAGHPSALRHLRADIFIGKLDGRYATMTDEQLFTHLLATIPTPPPPTPQPAPQQPAAGPEQPAPRQEAAAADGSDVDSEHSTMDASAAAGDDGADHAAAGNDGDAAPDNQCGADPRDDGDDAPDDRPGNRPGHPSSRPEDRPADGGPGAPDPDRSTGGGVRGRGLRLSIALTTLAGLDCRPGELVGFAVLHAELARTVAAAPGTAWSYVLTDEHGTPLQVAPIRRRPTTAWHDGPTPAYSNVEAWIEFTRQDLARLREHPPPGWQRLLDELAHRIAHSPGGPPNGAPTDRLPGRALRRWLHIRDRHCIFPTCGIPAHRGDADHTIEHGKGGPTRDANLGMPCGRHHALRHTGGWTLTQPRPGHFRWTSPLGHSYERHPPHRPAVTAMPTPGDPADDQFWIQVSDRDLARYYPTDTCKIICFIPPPRPEPPPPPPPPAPTPNPADDVPPF